MRRLCRRPIWLSALLLPIVACIVKTAGQSLDAGSEPDGGMDLDPRTADAAPDTGLADAQIDDATSDGGTADVFIGHDAGRDGAINLNWCVRPGAGLFLDGGEESFPSNPQSCQDKALCCDHFGPDFGEFKIRCSNFGGSPAQCAAYVNYFGCAGACQ